MKGRIPFPQTKCKSVVPDSYINQMKNALKTIEYGDFIIGPKTVDELFKHNTAETNYPHCIFNEIIKEKIIQDYNTIKDGLELLEFYKSNNKYFSAFDFEIEKLTDLYESKKREKFYTKDISISTENTTIDDINLYKNRKIWQIYFDGIKKTNQKMTLMGAIKFGKANMSLSSYHEVLIKLERR